MRKIIFVLLAFLAVFTYIRVFDGAEASTVEASASAGAVLPADSRVSDAADIASDLEDNTENSVEIVR